MNRPLRSIEVDITDRCNLTCNYCYRPSLRDMDISGELLLSFLELGFRVGAFSQDFHLHFFGGEPLLAFEHLRSLIPNAKATARRTGNNLSWGITSNLTLLSDHIAQFFLEEGGSIHASVDGTPKAHDQHRCFLNGEGSARIVERNIPRALRVSPHDTARLTVTPQSVSELADGVRHLYTKGFQSVAAFPAVNLKWDPGSIKEWRRQWLFLIDDRAKALGTCKPLRPLDDALVALVRPNQKCSRRGCGAAHSFLAMDTGGNLWPCHRFTRGAAAAMVAPVESICGDPMKLDTF